MISRPVSPIYLPSLTALRYFAALGILIHHSLKPFALGEPAPWLSGALGGGVSFFFVLSGFVLTLSAQQRASGQAGKRASGQAGKRAGGQAGKFDLPDYYFKRAARVLPLYWVTGVLAVVVWIARDRWEGATRLLTALPGDPWTALGLFFGMLQSWFPLLGYPTMFNGPAWSLSVEALFYCVLPLIVFLPGRRLLGIIVPSCFVIVAVCAISTNLIPDFSTARGYPLIQFFPPVRLLEFVAGVVAARVFIDRAPKVVSLRPSVLLVAGIGVMVAWLCLRRPAYMQLNDGSPDAFAVYLFYCGGFAFFALGIFLCAMADVADRAGVIRKLLANPILQLLGNASFALYLLHMPLRIAVSPEWLKPAWGFAAYFVLVHVAAIFAYLVIERPAQRALNGWWRNRRALVNAK